MMSPTHDTAEFATALERLRAENPQGYSRLNHYWPAIKHALDHTDKSYPRTATIHDHLPEDTGLPRDGLGYALALLSGNNPADHDLGVLDTWGDTNRTRYDLTTYDAERFAAIGHWIDAHDDSE